MAQKIREKLKVGGGKRKRRRKKLKSKQSRETMAEKRDWG